jgi:sugar phosphate permease
MALCGLPFYYDFMVQQFGWTRAQVTSGNALSKLVVGPVFGFIAGWVVDRFGPRRLMMTGVLMAGFALVGLGSISSLGMFYFFYMLDALGYVCGGPLRNQVLLSRRFDKARGKAMGFAYLGIGLGGAAAPWISHALVQHFGWQAALRTMGLLVVVIALPAAFFAKDAPQSKESRAASDLAKSRDDFSHDAFFPSDFGQHVFHRSGQWYPAKSKVVLEFGSSFYAEPGHEVSCRWYWASASSGVCLWVGWQTIFPRSLSCY